MTVDYSNAVHTKENRTWFNILVRWRGSLYKLIWPNMIVYFCLYYTLSAYNLLVLRHLPESDLEVKYFVVFVKYSRTFTDQVPLTLILAFYVSLVVNRWWKTFQSIPWPNGIAILTTALIRGADERGRLIRRTMVRYVILGWIFLMSMISPQIQLRFPTYEHLIEAGMLLPHEKMILETMNVNSNSPKYWVPLGWARSLASRAKREERIKNTLGLNMLVEEILKFRMKLGDLLNYDWIQIPLVYTQAVTIATYSYFVASAFAKQAVEEEAVVDLYIPVFHILEFVFYMGWMKVAESLINPFGGGDDDFELNYLLDRHVRLSFLIVDDLYYDFPLMQKDMYWDCYSPEMIPYTEDALKYRYRWFQGAAHHLVTKFAEDQFITRSFRRPRARQPPPPLTEYQKVKEKERLERQREEIERKIYPDAVGKKKEVAPYNAYDNASDVDFELRHRLRNAHIPKFGKTDLYSRVALVYKVIAERKRKGSLQTSGYWGSISGPVLADNAIFYETEFHKRFVRSDQPILYEDVRLVTIDATKEADRLARKKTFWQKFFSFKQKGPGIP